LPSLGPTRVDRVLGVSSPGPSLCGDCADRREPHGLGPARRGGLDRYASADVFLHPPALRYARGGRAVTSSPAHLQGTE